MEIKTLLDAKHVKIDAIQIVIIHQIQQDFVFPFPEIFSAQSIVRCHLTVHWFGMTFVGYSILMIFVSMSSNSVPVVGT